MPRTLSRTMWRGALGGLGATTALIVAGTVVSTFQRHRPHTIERVRPQTAIQSADTPAAERRRIAVVNHSQQAWSPEYEDGKWGAFDVQATPALACTLPAIANRQGYFPNVQTDTRIRAACPNIDWATLKRLYIPAGAYDFLQLGNLPRRHPEDPLVITNKGGQVVLSDISIGSIVNGVTNNGGSGWVLTGRYDPISKTGHPGFPGHKGGRYDNAQYGIVTDGKYQKTFGISVLAEADRFEIEFIEVRRPSFAGIAIKTDGKSTTTAPPDMRGVRLHDLYIHDTLGGEGMYIGSTQQANFAQHKIVDISITNNRVLRTGAEGIQLGQVSGNSVVRNNVVVFTGLKWRTAFQPAQDHNTQISHREGVTTVERNIFVGTPNFMLNVHNISNSGYDAGSDNPLPSDGIFFRHNLVGATRRAGPMLKNAYAAPAGYKFEWANNDFFGYRFSYDAVYPPTEGNPLDNWFYVVSGLHEISLRDNRFDISAQRVANTKTGVDADGNGIENNVGGWSFVRGSGNSRASIPSPVFANIGPQVNDLAGVEWWAARNDIKRNDGSQISNGLPVTYAQGALALRPTVESGRSLPRVWRCMALSCTAELEPENNTAQWVLQPDFIDDVRIAVGTPHADKGLAY